ncbi:MAG: CinA family protein [Succinivibrio sp.]|nr:CinA family protein [Succinivibrio sp.]
MPTVYLQAIIHCAERGKAVSSVLEECHLLAVRLSDLYSRYHKVYATAESLTAGLIGATIVEIPGSSAWFDRGFITYSNEAKQQLLGVSAEILKDYGAVSMQTVRQMVSGALDSSIADIAVAVTGIAGPDGGSREKPVGTVWIGVQQRGNPSYARCFLFAGSRQEVRNQTVLESLKALVSVTEGLIPQQYS